MRRPATTAAEKSAPNTPHTAHVRTRRQRSAARSPSTAAAQESANTAGWKGTEKNRNRSSTQPQPNSRQAAVSSRAA